MSGKNIAAITKTRAALLIVIVVSPVLVSFAVSGIILQRAGISSGANCGQTSVAGLIPLNDLGSGTYKGYTGGLYPNGTNTIPSSHLSAGMAPQQVVPRDTS